MERSEGLGGWQVVDWLCMLGIKLIVTRPGLGKWDPPRFCFSFFQSFFLFTVLLFNFNYFDIFFLIKNF